MDFVTWTDVLSNLAGILTFPPLVIAAALVWRHLTCPIEGCWRIIRHGHRNCPKHKGAT